MYCARTARQATPQECHEIIAQTTDGALYSTCRACATGQCLMASVQWAKDDGADASPIYNDTEETIMAKKTTKPANFDQATLPKKTAKTATAPTTETPAQVTAPAEAKTYTIIDVCERTQLPYGTVYGAIRDLKRGKPATSPSQQTVKEVLKTMRIGAADLVSAPKGKKPKDSPMDELAAAQALAIVVAPALEESKMPDVPAADPADPQPDEGDSGTLDQAVDAVAQLTAMPSPAPLRIQRQPTVADDEFFRDSPEESVIEQAVIQGISSLHRALSLSELPLEDLLAELQRRMPQAEVVVRIGPAAAA